MKNILSCISGTSILKLKKDRIFYGWWIVILRSIIYGVESGILYQSFTVFFLPLKRDFGVDSAAMSLLYGAARLEGGLEGPIVGYLMNKFGPRAIIIAGGIMAGVGLILLSTVQGFWPFFFIFIFIVSLGYNAGSFHPITTAVNNWFIRHRGVGFSWIMASMSVGGMMMMAPLLSHIIVNLGWRAGTFTAGLIILIVSIPAAIPIHRSPEVLGLHPDGKPFNASPSQKPDSMQIQTVDFDFTVREALKTRTYWMLNAAISLRLFVTIALNAHLIPILVWRGISETTAAYFVSLFAFGTIIATLGMG
jgi:sugar phosphate permease